MEEYTINSCYCCYSDGYYGCEYTIVVCLNDEQQEMFEKMVKTSYFSDFYDNNSVTKSNKIKMAIDIVDFINKTDKKSTNIVESINYNLRQKILSTHNNGD